MDNTDNKNRDLCEGCTMCCEYVTVELDDPDEKVDFEEIIWMIQHQNVIVYKDDEGTWNVEFKTPCKHLGSDGLCQIYDERSDICKDHNQDECEKHGEGDYYKVLFKTKQDVLDWVKKNTDIKDLN